MESEMDLFNIQRTLDYLPHLIEERDRLKADLAALKAEC